MATILVAAGGRGDAITAVALAAPLNLGEPVVIMTYSWHRLMIDPLPGPRAVGDFTRLNQLAPTIWEVTSHIRPVAPAGSSLPKSAGSVPGQLLLLDPSTGAIGTAEQITGAAEYFEAEELVLVDVGGAALTTGHDPGRSPDRRSTCHCRLSTHPHAGSADRRWARGGELDPATLRRRLKDLCSQRLPTVTATDLDPVRGVFQWQPREASRLILAAADGHRGYVQVRDVGDQIALTDDTASLHGLDLDELRLDVPAAGLVDSSSLSDAEDIIERTTGISELRYETQKAARRNGSHAHPVTTADLDQVNHQAQQAADHGADYISLRRPLRTRRSHHPRRLRGTRPTARPASARAVRTFELPRQLSITAR